MKRVLVPLVADEFAYVVDGESTVVTKGRGTRSANRNNPHAFSSCC
jgi:uncharacterized cupin superfamily protein